MKAHPGLLLKACLVLALGAAVCAPACMAASARADGQHAARIRQIMQRLRDVRRFGAVSVAPDGREMAWTLSLPPRGRVRAGAKSVHILQIAAADGTHVRTVRIAHAVKSCRYSDLHWSPDSRTLAFLSNCNHARKTPQQLDIYEVGAEGTVARRVSHVSCTSSPGRRAAAR